MTRDAHPAPTRSEPSEPLDAPRPDPREGWAALLVALIVTAACLGASWGHWVEIGNGDDGTYIDAAEGRRGRVTKPFANRILHAATVRGLIKLTGVSTHAGFLAVGVACLVLYFYAVVRLSRAAGWGWASAGVVSLLPLVPASFESGYMPDLPHAALTAAFLLLLLRRRYAGAVVVVFLLQLVRESTALLSGVTVLVCLARSQKTLALGVAGATAAAMATVAWLTRGAAGNIHALGTGVYLVLKLPFNYAKNLFGLVFWVNSFGDFSEAPPVWTADIPAWLRVGSLRQWGYSRFTPERIVDNFGMLLTLFGAGPAVLAALWRTRRARLGGRRGIPDPDRAPAEPSADRAGSPQPLPGRRDARPRFARPRAAAGALRDWLRQTPAWVGVAAVYGVISYLLGPGLGAAIYRLIGYGWPAFVVAAPFLLERRWALDPGARRRLLAAHLLLAWSPPILGRAWPASVPYQGHALLAAAVALQVYAYALLRSCPPAETSAPAAALARVR